MDSEIRSAMNGAMNGAMSGEMSGEVDAANDSSSMSRRALVTGFGAVGVAAGLGVAGLSVGPAVAAPGVVPTPAVLATPNAALNYLNIDATAFHTYASGRYVDDITGVGSSNPPARVAAPLMLEVGSVVRQLNVGYQGEPILEIFKRDFVTPTPWQMPFQQTLPAGGGPKTITINLPTPITIAAGSSYSVQFYAPPGASLVGLTVGYSAASARFLPFAGANPRAYDSRQSGGRMTSGEERSIPLGFPGASAALVNVTVTETAGLGFVAAFADGIVYPGNSTINWTSSGTTTANGAVIAMSTAGAIKLRCEVGSTHVIVDRLGWFL